MRLGPSEKYDRDAAAERDRSGGEGDRDTRAGRQPLADEGVRRGAQQRADGDRSRERAPADRRGAGQIVQGGGGDARHQPCGEDGREPASLERGMGLAQPPAPPREPARRGARDRTRERERREPAENGAAPSQRRPADRSERESARRGEQRAREERRREDEPRGERRYGGGIAGGGDEFTQSGGGMGQHQRHGGDRQQHERERAEAAQRHPIEASGPPVDVSCVVHVHTTYSDGTATVAEIAAAAEAAGADAVLVTDHDSLGARRDGWEGRHGTVVMLVGTEVSPRGGHYLAFGVDREIGHAGRSASEVAAAVRQAGGVGFAAHPFSDGGRMLVPAVARRVVRPHGWPELDDPEGCDGIELWSLTTDAAEGWRTPGEAVRWLRNPEAAIAGGPPAHHLRRWDALSALRRLPAIGGLDGHQPGLRVRGGVYSPLSHRRTFGLLRTHLLCERRLTGDPAVDWSTVRRALAAGAAWLSCPCVAAADGARLWAEGLDGRIVPMGAEAPAGRSVLRVRLPRAADVRVVRDGAPWRHARGSAVDVDIAARGVYRVEARIDRRLWLLSNAVHLR